jgi:hypothetical protein
LEAPVRDASCEFELCGSFGGIFDDELFAADLAGEISNLLNGFLSDCHLFADDGGGIDGGAFLGEGNANFGFPDGAGG